MLIVFSMRNYDFERHAGGFLKHTKEEHSIWAYLKFFMHLQHKKRTNYTANEDLVARSVGIIAKDEDVEDVEFNPDVDETACFPINKALSIIHATAANVKDFLLFSVSLILTG